MNAIKGQRHACTLQQTWCFQLAACEGFVTVEGVRLCLTQTSRLITTCAQPSDSEHQQVVADLGGVCWQWLALQHRQPALQHELVHALLAAICCQQVQVSCADPRLPCCLKGGACRSEVEALCTGMGHAWHIRLELQHKGPMIASNLAHTRLTALLQMGTSVLNLTINGPFRPVW